MSFAIIDQGRRVITPLKTLFPDKGVAQTSASEAAHGSTHNEKDLQSENSEFRKIMELRAFRKQHYFKRLCKR